MPHSSLRRLRDRLSAVTKPTGAELAVEASAVAAHSQQHSPTAWVSPRCPSNASVANSDSTDMLSDWGLGPEDFEVSHCVGRGSYASVYVARHVDTHELCALKAVPKRKAAQEPSDLRHLRHEKEVMELMNSPFVVGARGTFQDGHYVYFALDYHPGGDLYRLLRKAGGRLPLDHVQFYAAGALLAIEHVHRRGCVHRDIKPENILLDADGYPQLTDFGFARRLEEGEKVLSMFGTPEYVAPEVLLGQGHAQAADLWSLGVLIYELLVGCTPWLPADGGGDCGQPQSKDGIYKQVVSGNVEFPPDMDPCARDLMARLLEQDPRKRLGGVFGGGPGGLRAHGFFRVDWAALSKKRAPAPYVPAVGRPEPSSRGFSPLVHSDGSWEDAYGGAFDGF